MVELIRRSPEERADYLLDQVIQLTGEAAALREEFTKERDRLFQLFERAQDAQSAALLSDKEALLNENRRLATALRGGTALSNTASLIRFLADRIVTKYGEDSNTDYLRAAHERAGMIDRALAGEAP
jgi:hypothetical protein